MDRSVTAELRFAEPGSAEHDQALDLRTEAFFMDHGGRSATEARDRPGADHPVIIADEVVVACGQGHVENGAYHVTQMVVAEAHRGQGLATLVLAALLDRASERGLVTVRLEARSHVVGFYRRHGFVAMSEPRAIGPTGVPHVAMERASAPDEGTPLRTR